MTVDIPSQNSRYWLLTMPRTASNMLVKILNLDEQGARPAFNGGYFFFPSMLARMGVYDKPSSEWTPEELANVKNSTQKSLEKLQDHIEAAGQDGQRIFVKEHISFLNSPYCEQKYMYDKSEESLYEMTQARGFPQQTRSSLNNTSLPDEFLKTWYPTFLIRHPGLMFPSLYRTALQGVEMDGKGRKRSEPYDVECTLKFCRALHEFYSNHFGKNSQWPVLLDADDVIASPELVMKYANLVGLDPEKLKFTWEKVAEDKMAKLSPGEKIMLSSINASTGVDKGKMAGSLNIDTEAEKWRKEFGEEGGNKLEKWVRDAMPDYEYLRSKRLTLD